MAIGRIPEPGTGIPESIVDAKGDIVTATAADTPARLAVGTNEQRLVADSAAATGLKYVSDTTNYAVAAKGDLLVGTAADTVAVLSVGTNGHTLVADSSVSPTGLKWAAPSSGLTLIKTATFSNVADTGTTFDDVFSSTYENYYISINEFYGATSTADLHFQYRYAGPTTQAATYQYRSFKLEGQAPTTQTLQGESAVNQFMMCDAIGNNAGYGVNGWVDINKLKASSRPFANWRFYTESEQTIFGGGYQYTARTYTGFLLKGSTGNVYGTVSVYGLAK